MKISKTQSTRLSRTQLRAIVGGSIDRECEKECYAMCSGKCSEGACAKACERVGQVHSCNQCDFYDAHL